MKDRIREIMESEDYTPARFADTLDIGRAIVSHILNGRNNPSLDVISRILETFPKINPDWLLFGIGNMYRDNSTNQDSGKSNNHIEAQNSTEKKPFDLFSQTDIFIDRNAKVEPTIANNKPDTNNITTSIPTEHIVPPVASPSPSPENEIIQEKIVYKTLPTKKINQIIIYYDDNTFEVFNR